MDINHLLLSSYCQIQRSDLYWNCKLGDHKRAYRRRVQVRRFIFLFALISLIGTTALVEANINKKHVPKYPKLVDQRPDAPKLVARDDYYSPRFLQVRVVAGNEISLVNKGGNIHGLVIPALSQINVIRPGESKMIPVEEDAKPGMYDFFCHLHPRMRGTIEILPKT
ncbi:hypothetical protein MNODULE_04015 [Nitrospiraceae bacterium HYJII51-Mn-bac16s-1-B09]|uniref:EfeO-type cupredoxin-like domain-containing protein n=1 Tax=Candidatus Manganitrophus noduliformans TaxID=2606439 RepID=A0A7X6I9Q2_9BACT|nr:hypothetical protein [Candidatus Manganitrophus noduliformans]